MRTVSDALFLNRRSRNMFQFELPNLMESDRIAEVTPFISYCLQMACRFHSKPIQTIVFAVFAVFTVFADCTAVL